MMVLTAIATREPLYHALFSFLFSRNLRTSCNKRQHINYVSIQYANHEQVRKIPWSITCPILSHKPRHVATNTWTSNTLWRLLMVWISWSFKGCILLRITDSTRSFESWMIFLSFVVFCARVCTYQTIQ